MTIKEWMVNNYFEHGREWLKNASDLCKDEVGHNYSPENWSRAVRRVISEFETTPEEETGEVAKVYKEEDKKKGTTFYEVTAENIRTVEDLINYCEVDMDVWEVSKIVSNRWGSGETPMWQVKAWFAKKTEADMTPQDYAKQFHDLTKNFTPPVTTKKKTNMGDMLLEISLYDVHYGQLSWGPETGSDNYDIKIAAQLYSDAIDHFVEVGGANIGKYMLVVGHDLFNSDSPDNTTFAGTPQAEDTRWQKTFLTAESMIIEQIEKLRALAPVDIVIVPGNHDKTRVFYFGEFLKAWYRNCDDVVIDNTPNKHKYYEYGNTFLMLTHGDGLHGNALPLFMVQDQPEKYARAKFREIHKGHFHSASEKKYQLSKNTHGITEVVMPSLVPRDDWHNAKGYGSERQSTAIAWTKDKGRYATYYFYP